MKETEGGGEAVMLRGDAAERICLRLSHLEGLYFPNALHRSNELAVPSRRKSLLMDLLSSDAAVFLERYGSQLQSNELEEFAPLDSDYEINWHLKHLRSVISPTNEEKHLRSLTVKNRRRAYLCKLIDEGEYFSEDSMREREPYLHHEYVGKFQDPLGRCFSRPGERLSDTLLRRCDEAAITEQIRKEQQRLGVPEEEWVGGGGGDGNEEEEVVEEEEEEEEEEDRNECSDMVLERKEMELTAQVNQATCDTLAVENNPGNAISEEEMQDQMDQFTHIMEQKFLDGEDVQHVDYSKIDDDETLDEYWLKEVTYDAEDKYFEED